MTKRTPLYDRHVALGAKMVEFAGWQMPVQYSGVKDEHLAVRQRAGLFDVSHMGEIEIAGPDAATFAQYLTTNDVATMIDGKAMYSLLLNERATVIDDVILYRLNSQRFIFVVNASNREKDYRWILDHRQGDVTVRDRSDDYALLAFQGPLASEVLQTLTSIDLPSIRRYHFGQGTVAGIEHCIIARTGYTGEDGFELFVSPAHAATIWNALLQAGASKGIKPAGLGARDTLRLEMKYSLYGHEITEETNPYEAGLGWVVKLDQPGAFIGKDELIAIKERGPMRKLVGFRMMERAIPRQGYPIVFQGNQVGVVTSGTLSPSLDQSIGIGFVPPDLAATGSQFFVDIRGRLRQAEVVKTPFYQR